MHLEYLCCALGSKPTKATTHNHAHNLLHKYLHSNDQLLHEVKTTVFGPESTTSPFCHADYTAAPDSALNARFTLQELLEALFCLSDLQNLDIL